MKPSSWGADLADLFLPGGCVSCGAWIRGARRLVCGTCLSRLREPSWPRCARCHHPSGTGRSSARDCLECLTWPKALDRARCAYVLRRPADDLVHALKYEGWREVADVMARAIGTVALHADGSGVVRGAVVVPVPTTERRLAERGYNQAGLIAERLAARRSLPLCNALYRQGRRRSQTSLSPAERRENVRGVFSAAADAPRTIRGAHVLLVDDVLTTGATAGEAASVLADVGASSVTLLAFARALPT